MFDLLLVLLGKREQGLSNLLQRDLYIKRERRKLSKVNYTPDSQLRTENLGSQIFRAMHLKALISGLLVTLALNCQGMGIGGGTLMYSSRGFFPRQRNLRGVTSRGHLGGGVMYFRDPSPSHLRYPSNSYKTRRELAEKERQDETRWDWINSMTEQYHDDQDPVLEAEALPSTMSRITETNSYEDQETEAERIINGLLRKIRELDSKPTAQAVVEKPQEKDEYSGRFSKESLANSGVVGPRPPLLLMG